MEFCDLTLFNGYEFGSKQLIKKYFSSSSSNNIYPTTPGLSTGTLPVRTTQEIGLSVPLGLIVNELRTSADQSLVFDSTTGAASLESPISSESGTDDKLEASVVRETLRRGFSLST